MKTRSFQRLEKLKINISAYFYSDAHRQDLQMKIFIFKNYKESKDETNTNAEFVMISLTKRKKEKEIRGKKDYKIITYY